MVQDSAARDSLRVCIFSKWWEGRGPKLHALKHIDFTLEPGESLSILGKSGIGKSTLLRVIAGVEDNFDGSVSVGGQPIRVGKGDIGLVYQQNRLFDHMTALENVAFASGEPADASRAAALKWLQRVGLTDRADAFPKDLSEGQKKRVAIARGLVRPPKFLLLDEPLAGLDPDSANRISADLRSLQEEHGFGCIVTTHDPREAVALSSRAFFLSGVPATISRVLDIPQVPEGSQEHEALVEAVLRILAEQ